jgi:hypothetical protein
MDPPPQATPTPKWKIAFLVLVLLFILGGLAVRWYLSTRVPPSIIKATKAPSPQAGGQATQPAKQPATQPAQPATQPPAQPAQQATRNTELEKALAQVAKTELKDTVKTGAIVLSGAAAIFIAGRMLAVLKVKLAKRLEAQMGKSVSRVLARYTPKIIQTVGTKATAQIGKMVGGQAAKSLGTLARVLSSPATLAFEATSIALDIFDVGDYGNLNSMSFYKVIRDAANKDLADAQRAAGLEPPLIAGPLDALMTPEQEAKFDEEMATEITAIFAKPDHPVVKPLYDALSAAASKGHVDLNDSAAVDSFLDANFELVSTERLFSEAILKLCTKHGGLNITVNGNPFCSFSQKQCGEQYKWPPDESDAAYYTEWDGILGGCKVASPVARLMAEEHGLQYDVASQLPIITPEYCAKKGGEIRTITINGKSYTDCVVPRGQKIAEFIFGTTITRGLKQVFDSRQYSPCPPGHKDIGYACTYQGCPEGYEMRGALCYRKCPEGWTSDGLNRCYQNAPDGWAGTKTITHLQKDRSWSRSSAGSWCPDGKVNYAGLCYDVPSGWRMVSPGIRKTDCPSGWRDDGTGCWKDMHTFGRGTGYGKESSCTSKEGVGCEKWGFLWYPKCPDLARKRGHDEPDAYHNSACCVCTRDPIRRGNVQSVLGTVPECGPGKTRIGALCYPVCPDGYERQGGDIEACSSKCPSGFKDIGIGGCERPASWIDTKMPIYDFRFKKRAVPYGKAEDPLGNATAFGEAVVGMAKNAFAKILDTPQ